MAGGPGRPKPRGDASAFSAGTARQTPGRLPQQQRMPLGLPGCPSQRRLPRPHPWPLPAGILPGPPGMLPLCFGAAQCAAPARLGPLLARCFPPARPGPLPGPLPAFGPPLPLGPQSPWSPPQGWCSPQFHYRLSAQRFAHRPGLPWLLRHFASRRGLRRPRRLAAPSPPGRWRWRPLSWSCLAAVLLPWMEWCHPAALLCSAPAAPHKSAAWPAPAGILHRSKKRWGLLLHNRRSAHPGRPIFAQRNPAPNRRRSAPGRCGTAPGIPVLPAACPIWAALPASCR